MENTAREKAEKPRGKASRIFFAASVIYSLISFLFYIGLDAYKIYRDGWTAANIVVTVFLALQIVLYAIFLAAGAEKKHKKQYKAGKKSLKIAKKVVNKVLSVATSAAVIVGAGSAAGLMDILALAVAAVALAMTITEVIWRIILFVIARKLKKTVREKLGAQEGESLVKAAGNKAKSYIGKGASSQAAATDVPKDAVGAGSAEENKSAYSKLKDKAQNTSLYRRIKTPQGKPSDKKKQPPQNQ